MNTKKPKEKQMLAARMKIASVLEMQTLIVDDIYDLLLVKGVFLSLRHIHHAIALMVELGEISRRPMNPPKQKPLLINFVSKEKYENYLTDMPPVFIQKARKNSHKEIDDDDSQDDLKYKFNRVIKTKWKPMQIQAQTWLSPVMELQQGYTK
jgi:hypothetical protein